MKEIIIALISILPGMATLIVGLVTNKKVKKQDKMREEIKDLRVEMNGKLDKLDKKVDENRKKELRTILVNEYTALINGNKKSKEQKQDISDMFEEYKSLGGNSYIDDLHDIWKEKEIINVQD